MVGGKGQTVGLSSSLKSKKKQSRQEDVLVNKPGESSSMASGKGKMIQEDLITDDLMESLQRHDASFTALLSLIPANFYLANESDSEEESELSLSLNENNQTNKRNSAEALAEERKARIREAKRAKHDPDNQKNAIEVQQERAAQRAKKLAAREKEDEDMSLQFSIGRDLISNGAVAGDTDDDEEDSENGEEDEDDVDDASSYETLPTSTKGSEELSDKPAIPSPLPGTGPPNILDLRARLQAKIQGIQAQRRAQSSGNHSRNNDIGDDESIASTKDELLEERRKQRGEMRDRRRKAAKERKRAEREGTGKKGNVQNAGNDKKGGSSAPSLFVSPAKGGFERQSSSLANQVEMNDVEFSSLQFDEESSGKRNKHALPSDPKAALAILEARKRKEEARKAKIAARSGEDGEEDVAEFEKERADHLRWSKAEAAAQGVKIRDDEKLLRKAAKKKDKQKSKSSLEWNKRSRDLATQQAARQKKRTENIAARKDRKSGKGGKTGGSSSSNAHSAKSKALGSKRKSGGSRPGFEGKRRPLGGGGGGGKGGSGSGGKKSGGHGRK